MKYELGKKIAELRKAYGMSQEELAGKLNLTFQAVSKWETGAGFPDIELLPLLAGLFHVSIDYLLGNSEAQNANYYDKKYVEDAYYWGTEPSHQCYAILRHLPPTKRLRLLDIGCGEGRDAVFFARNGYEVTAFDLAEAGVEKTQRLARQAGVSLKAFVADVNTYRPDSAYDIYYSNGVLHYIAPALRKEIFDSYKANTPKGGIHLFSAFVAKPFIAPPPEKEENASLWLSGELFTLYHDWQLEMCEEEIFNCNSSGIPHQHAMDRILALKRLD